MVHAPARADAGVLVLPAARGQVRASLVEALRIQLTDAEVAIGAPVPASGLAGNLEHASGELSRTGAALAVWIEWASAPGDVRRTAILYVVGHERDLALVRVARIEGEDESELDRALALTIAELLDNVLVLQRDDASSSTPLTQRFARSAPAEPRPAAVRQPWRFSVELGGGAWIWTGTPSASAMLRAGALLRYEGSRWWLEAGAFVSPQTRVAAQSEEVRVDLDDVDAELALRVLLRVSDPFAIGGALGLGFRWIEARAAADGRSGSDTEAIPTALLGVDGRIALADSAEIRLGAGVELALIDHVFTADGALAFQVGVARPFATASIVITVP